MILFLTHILCGTNPIWPVLSLTPAFAYLPAAREVKLSGAEFSHVAGHRRYFWESREGVDIVLENWFGPRITF
jgi:hypothetical protein